MMRREPLTRREPVRRAGSVVAALVAVAALTGCVRAPMEATLPPLIEEGVEGSYDVEFRAGPTASPGLNDIEVTFKLDREPVTADDLAAVIDAIFETNSLFSVYEVSVRVYTENTDDGFGCLDLADAIEELGLAAHEFTFGDCTSLLADYDELKEWHDAR